MKIFWHDADLQRFIESRRETIRIRDEDAERRARSEGFSAGMAALENERHQFLRDLRAKFLLNPNEPMAKVLIELDRPVFVQSQPGFLSGLGLGAISPWKLDGRTGR